MITKLNKDHKCEYSSVNKHILLYSTHSNTIVSLYTCITHVSILV